MENAVSHGLELKEDCGRIELDVRSEEERLVIQVSDDGVGFDPEEVLGNRAPEENDTKERDCDALYVHVGLANISKLIRILYGDDYGIAI